MNGKKSDDVTCIVLLLLTVHTHKNATTLQGVWLPKTPKSQWKIAICVGQKKVRCHPWAPKILRKKDKAKKKWQCHFGKHRTMPCSPVFQACPKFHTVERELFHLLEQPSHKTSMNCVCLCALLCSHVCFHSNTLCDLILKWFPCLVCTNFLLKSVTAYTRID